MFRKVVLLICLAFIIVFYAYPCFILPFGQYECTTKVGDEEVVTTMTFGFDGKVKTKAGDADEVTNYYKIDGNKVIISTDETFDDSDTKITLTNVYTFSKLDNGEIKTYTNKIGFYTAIGVGALDLLFILISPNKRKAK